MFWQQVWRCAPLILCLVSIPACSSLAALGAATRTPDGTSAADATTTPEDPTTPPSVTPEPLPALDPAQIWVGVEGLGDSVMSILPDGSAAVAVRLPLNVGQRASSVTASPDGRYLAYLVWNADGSQRGIATWNLAEPNARLIVEAQPGSRIIALALAGDSSSLAYVQVTAGTALPDAEWQVRIAPAGGGPAQTIATRETLADVAPLVPFAWPANGPLLLNAAIPRGLSQGIYAVNPATAAGRQLIALDNELVDAPALSPDGTRLAYVGADPEAAAEDSRPPTVAFVYDLRLNTLSSMAADPGQSITSLRWHPDGERLLLDITTPAAEGSGPGSQVWALAQVGQPPPWPQSEPGPERANLFDYQPYGADGVAYTLLPVDQGWELHLLPSITGPASRRVVSLNAIAQAQGAPTIIRIP